MWMAVAAAVSVSGLSSGSLTLLFAWLSPIFTAILLLKVSGVPMVTAAGEKKWGLDPEYQRYMQETPMLIPTKERLEDLLKAPAFAPALAGWQKMTKPDMQSEVQDGLL